MFKLLAIVISFFCCLFQMSSVQEKMDQFIKDFPIFMVSKSYCPFCHTAKDVLNKYDIPPEKMKVIEIEGYPDCAEIQDYMSQLTGGRTVSLFWIMHPTKYLSSWVRYPKEMYLLFLLKNQNIMNKEFSILIFFRCQGFL